MGKNIIQPHKQNPYLSTGRESRHSNIPASLGTHCDFLFNESVGGKRNTWNWQTQVRAQLMCCIHQSVSGSDVSRVTPWAHTSSVCNFLEWLIRWVPPAVRELYRSTALPVSSNAIYKEEDNRITGHRLDTVGGCRWFSFTHSTTGAVKAVVGTDDVVWRQYPAFKLQNRQQLSPVCGVFK